MKKFLFSLVPIFLVGLLILAPGSASQAASSSQSLAPVAIVNLAGGAVGPVARMAV